MKKFLSILMIALLLLGLVGCGELPTADSDKLQIVCTVFPPYDWVRNVLGDRLEEAELTLLMDNGADLHNYQATVEDLLKISTCDLFIHIGGESDAWVADALKDPANTGRKVLSLMETVEPLELPHSEEEHEHGDEDHEHIYDEHIWLSLKNAHSITGAIVDTLAELDPAHAEEYKANAATYQQKVIALDEQYQQCADTAERKTLLFADRFPFLHLTKDYGLTYYAAYTGCSAEIEVSFATLAHLIEKTDELELPYIMITETGDQELAKTVISKTKTKDQEILTLDAMQAVTMNRAEEGATYLSIMESNLAVLEKALN